jgi:hypothetical protein
MEKPVESGETSVQKQQSAANNMLQTADSQANSGEGLLSLSCYYLPGVTNGKYHRRVHDYACVHVHVGVSAHLYRIWLCGTEVGGSVRWVSGYLPSNGCNCACTA